MTDVDVFFAEPDAWDDAALARGEAILSLPEQERARRFRFERDRRLYVVAHAMLRRALGGHLNVAPAALAFQHNAYGRPELDPRERARFSLAHAHGMAVCALTLDHDVGIDVEPLDRNLPMEVAKRCFAPAELADLHAQPESVRPERFYTYWTLKEAYVKARGIGLSLPVENAAFELLARGVEFHPRGGLDPNPKEWQFRSFRVGPRHQAALAIRAPSPPALTIRAIEPAR
jgi:4'-phosphopantetheinyl transferase